MASGLKNYTIHLFKPDIFSDEKKVVLHRMWDFANKASGNKDSGVSQRLLNGNRNGVMNGEHAFTMSDACLKSNGLI